MYGIGKIFKTKYGGLIFSLLAGCAYFVIILDFILKSTKGGMLLGFFFFPAIICGMALVIFKMVKKFEQEEAFGKINLLIYIHIALILLSLIFLWDIIAM